MGEPFKKIESGNDEVWITQPTDRLERERIKNNFITENLEKKS